MKNAILVETRMAAEASLARLPYAVAMMKALVAVGVAARITQVANTAGSRLNRRAAINAVLTGWTTSFRMQQGSSTETVPITLQFKDQHRDEYTSEPLPQSWVEEAIQEEVDHFNSRVWVGSLSNRH